MSIISNILQKPLKFPLYSGKKNSGHQLKYEFQSSLDENQFYAIWYFIDKEKDKFPQEIKLVEPTNYKETHYKSGKRKSVIFKGGEFIREDVIKKEDKMHLNIRDNGNDFRITSCVEMKTDITNEDEENGCRDKFRVSYKFRYFRLDFTIVSSFSKESINRVITHEVEFEFAELKDFMKPENCRGYDEFKIMFQRFIQNVQCFYKSSSQEFYKSIFGNTVKIKGPNESIYGDYFEKNILIN